MVQEVVHLCFLISICFIWEELPSNASLGTVVTLTEAINPKEE